MSIGALTARALRWLVKAFRFYRSRNTEFKAGIAALRAMGVGNKILEKLIKRLQRVEATVGAHTRAWPNIARAKKEKRGLTLTAAEVKYLFAFKKAFDELKKRFIR